MTCAKKKKVAARCKYCFETLIPGDKSCVEESSYRVLMYFFLVVLWNFSMQKRVWKFCAYFSWRMCHFLSIWILTFLNWVEIAVNSLRWIIISIETAADFETGKFGTGCSQEKEIWHKSHFWEVLCFCPF